MRGGILGVERRRRWSEDEKHEILLEILLEVGVDGASVTQVAQRHEITRSRIYGWRRDQKKKGLWSPARGAVFLPVARVRSRQASPRPRGQSPSNCGWATVAVSGSTAASTERR
jgi:transposase